MSVSSRTSPKDQELSETARQQRVAQVWAAGHVPVGKTELGYTRNVCECCDMDWPCPDFAQAAEYTDSLGADAVGTAPGVNAVAVPSRRVPPSPDEGAAAVNGGTQ